MIENARRTQHMISKSWNGLDEPEELASRLTIVPEVASYETNSFETNDFTPVGRRELILGSNDSY